MTYRNQAAVRTEAGQLRAKFLKAFFANLFARKTSGFAQA